jgi:hypothetical protein
MVVPPLRDFFNLYLLGARDLAIVLAGVLAWAVLVWIFWRWRFVDRFLGTDVEAAVPSRDLGSSQGTNGS